MARIPEALKQRGYLYFHSRAKHPVEQMLSTFWPAAIKYHGLNFPSIEHAFQAAKFLYSDRPDLFSEAARRVRGLTAAKAKSVGSKSGFKRLRATLDIDAWNANRLEVMQELVYYRAQHDPAYRQVLKEARDDGILLLHYEKAFGKRGAEPFWGGYFQKETGQYFGKNWLGKLMMTVQL